MLAHRLSDLPPLGTQSGKVTCSKRLRFFLEPEAHGGKPQ